jgi:hypothetical protein
MGITQEIDTVPIISAYLMPEDERVTATFVARQLSELASLTDQVFSAVELFTLAHQIAGQAERERQAVWGNEELARKAQISRQWPFMVARSAAIAIHDFCVVKGSLNTAWPTVPTFRNLVDGKAVDRANKLFNQYFPRTEAMRDAVCHSGKRALEDHSVATPGGVRISIGSCLTGSALNILQYSYKKKNEAQARMYELEISAGMLSRLLEVRDIYFSGFRGVDQR